MSLGKKAAKGALVTLLWQGAKIALQLVSLVVLARLLPPSEIGLVTMAIAFVGIANVIKDFGLSAGIIQAPAVSDDQLSNLLWLNIAFGLALGGAVYLSAWPIARFYDNEKLATVIHWLSPTFFLSSIGSQLQAVLQRSLRFNLIGKIDFSAQLLGVVAAIAFAYHQKNYTALIAQQITAAAVSTVLLFLFSSTRLRAPKRGVPLKDFLKFGANLSGTQVIAYISKNIDNIAVGRMYGAYDVGIYGRAYSLVAAPIIQIMSPLTRVALPILSKLREDERRYNAYLLDAQTTIVGAACVFYGSLAGLSNEVIDVLFGAQWMMMAPVVQWLCLGAIFRVLGQIPFWIFVSNGLTSSQLRAYVVGQPIIIAGILGGLPLGPVGVAAGSSLGLLIFWLHQMRAAARASGLPLRHLTVNGLRLGLVFAVPSALIPPLAYTASLPTWLHVAVSCVLITVYSAVALLAWKDARTRAVRVFGTAFSRKKQTL